MASLLSVVARVHRAGPGQERIRTALTTQLTGTAPPARQRAPRLRHDRCRAAASFKRGVIRRSLPLGIPPADGPGQLRCSSRKSLTGILGRCALQPGLTLARPGSVRNCGTRLQVLTRAGSCYGAGEMTPRPALSIVIPVYNAALTLDSVITELGRALEGLGKAFEIILVNDGSRDESWSKVDALCQKDARVRGIDLMRNYGQHNALVAGIRHATADVIVTMDDDGEHPPGELPRMLAKLDEGFDVVYGVPTAQQHGFLRDLASATTKLLLQEAMGADTARRISAFRVFRTNLRQGFINYRGSFVSLDVLLTWSTARFSAVEVEHRPRQAAQPNYTVRMLLAHAADMMTGFSTLPLQIASLVGFGFALFGLAVLAYVLGRFVLQGSPVPGFPFLASIIAIFSGAQLLALGIIGEYLGRAHFRLMDRPMFTVRQTRGWRDAT